MRFAGVAQRAVAVPGILRILAASQHQGGSCAARLIRLYGLALGGLIEGIDRLAPVTFRDLQIETDQAFEEITDGLDPELAGALRTVTERPEVLSVLTENLQLAMALGEAWQNDPDEVEAAFDDLAVQVASNDQLEREEWAEKLEEDPELREEVEDDINQIVFEWQDKAQAIERYEVGLEKTDISVDDVTLVWIPVGP